VLCKPGPKQREMEKSGEVTKDEWRRVQAREPTTKKMEVNFFLLKKKWGPNGGWGGMVAQPPGKREEKRILNSTAGKGGVAQNEGLGKEPSRLGKAIEPSSMAGYEGGGRNDEKGKILRGRVKEKGLF